MSTEVHVTSWKQRYASRLRYHVAGILVAVVVGLISAAPPFVFHFSSAYKGVEMMKTNTETHYLGQVQEIYDGHYGLGNPYLSTDLKSQPYVFPPLGVYLTAGLGHVMQVSAVHAIMILRFVFVASLTFCIYLFVFQLSGRRNAALVAAPWVVLAYSAVDPGRLLSLLRGQGFGIETSFIDYGRPITPQVSSVFFFLFLNTMWYAIYGAGQRSRAYLFVSAVVLGMSMYVYFFTWTFSFLLLGCLAMVAVVKKDWQTVKKICLIGGVAGVIGIPYLFHVLTLTQHPWYDDMAQRFGFVYSRTPAFSRLVGVATLLFAVSWKKIQPLQRRFFIAVFSAAVIAVNEQLITGRYVFNEHYHWYYITPLVILFLVIVGFQWLTAASTRVCVAVTIMAVFGLFAYGVGVQVVSYQEKLPQVVDEQRYAPLFMWMRTSIPVGQTFFVGSPLDTLIPAVTPQNVYYSGNALYTLLSKEQLMHAYLAYTYLSGIPKDEVGTYFDAHRPDIEGYVFGYAYAFQKTKFPDTLLENLAAQYQLITTDAFHSFLRKYPVDMIIWDKKNDPTWQMDRFKFPVVATFGDLIVYQVPTVSTEHVSVR